MSLLHQLLQKIDGEIVSRRLLQNNLQEKTSGLGQDVGS